MAIIRKPRLKAVKRRVNKAPRKSKSDLTGFSAQLREMQSELETYMASLDWRNPAELNEEHKVFIQVISKTYPDILKLAKAYNDREFERVEQYRKQYDMPESDFKSLIQYVNTFADAAQQYHDASNEKARVEWEQVTDEVIDEMSQGLSGEVEYDLDLRPELEEDAQFVNKDEPLYGEFSPGDLVREELSAEMSYLSDAENDDDLLLVPEFEDDVEGLDIDELAEIQALTEPPEPTTKDSKMHNIQPPNLGSSEAHSTPNTRKMPKAALAYLANLPQNEDQKQHSKADLKRQMDEEDKGLYSKIEAEQAKSTKPKKK